MPEEQRDGSPIKGGHTYPVSETTGASAGELIARARDGDQRAWDEIVDRFNVLVMAVARAHRLNREDSIDVGQVVWMRLVQHLDKLHHPAALAGWIKVTATRECLKTIHDRARSLVVEPATAELIYDLTAPPAEPIDAATLREEERMQFAAAFAQLRSREQKLLRMLMRDPAPTYDEIAHELQMPTGAIGPTRQRAIQKLRNVITAMNGEGGSDVTI